MKMRMLKVTEDLNIKVLRASSISGSEAVSYMKKDIFIEKKDIFTVKKDDTIVSDSKTDFKEGTTTCGYEVLQLEGKSPMLMIPMISCTF